MGAKKDEKKKGAVSGNFKAGKQLKDILPANSKQPREGQLAKMDGESDVHRSYEFEPLQMLPEWPGNEEAKAHFKADFEASDPSSLPKFKEPEAKNGVGALYLPPSIKEFSRGELQWLRPDDYIREIMYEKEVHRRRQEKKREYKLRKQQRKSSLLALSSQTAAAEEQLQKQELELEALSATKLSVNKEDLHPKPKVIAFDERQETEAEIAKRKEAAEKAAAADKGAKKKAPPAKGVVVADPADEPQVVLIPIDGCLDMSFAMPKYVKWVTSQFQFIRDRTIRDVDSQEAIWQRIYPQENGIPVISPTGKYWVKIRFMGKERLVEIDDRIPCSNTGQPIFPRTCDHNEIWPQLLMKALLKVYSYKWYSPNCHYDSEIGDGSIVYSLTGLIPEKIQIKDLNQARELFKKYLSDEHYFGKKSFLTAYCENEFRPKFPSQNQLQAAANLPTSQFKHAGPGSTTQDYDGFSDSTSFKSSSQMMLNKLKDAASLAISVTTGKKPAFGAKERNLTNIIPGFGYAIMDEFENEFVNMESISKNKNQIIEENASPFASPQKSRTKRDKSISKEDFKKLRRERRKKEQEEYERREKEPPIQYSFVKIKTSIGKHPVINYLSTFTNDEILEGKKYLINHWRKDPTKPVSLPFKSPSPVKRGYGEHTKFKLDINDGNQNENQENLQDLKSPATKNLKIDLKNVLIPKTRAAGGIWLNQSDFPHAFQNIIVYHNIKKYIFNEVHQDIWDHCNEPYISNEKEIYIRLELDQDAIEKTKLEKKNNRFIGIQRPLGEEQIDPEELKEHDDGQGDASKRSTDRGPLPGQHQKPQPQFDNIIIACAPYPTNKPQEVLPRYMTMIKQIDCKIEGAEEQNKTISQTYKSYFEGVQFKILDEMSSQKTIWIKPEFNCPQGATLWIASQVRKIKIVSKVEYLQEQKGFSLKQVSSDYLPQQAGKFQMMGKYDFSIPDKDTILHIKVDTPADRYLLNFMRMKILDKSPLPETPKNMTETQKPLIINQMTVSNLKLTPNENYGYSLVIEGVLPYNTTEGQLVIDTLCNKDTFNLHEVVQCEPLEYVDTYVPTKYGIIFKEKIIISPSDHTSASLNIKLLKNGTEFGKAENFTPKYFYVEVLDNGKPIFHRTGYNQITISHIMFRCNQGLQESSQDSDSNVEVKHNYVIQALFDLNEWPEGKTVNEQSQDISWQIKMYSSETIALIKDTDKEDREKALKVSWETEEPGRAEKAKLSRQKFVIKMKQKNGEQLTQEEQEILHEKRERIRKRDQEDAAAAAKNVKGGKGAPPPKGGKPPPPEKTAAKGGPLIDEEEQSVAKIIYPKAEDHINTEIKEFLEHFSSSRKITQNLHKGEKAKKRDDAEKTQIFEEFNQALKQESEKFQEMSGQREKMKERRQQEREEAFKDIEKNRLNYKEDLKQVVMKERNQYREMIEGRKDKELALLDMIRQDKADPNALKALIDQAEDLMVSQKYIKRAKKFLEFMEYIKEFESFIQQAVVDKNKDILQQLLERVEQESTQLGSPLPIDLKILNDAKGNLAKMK